MRPEKLHAETLIAVYAQLVARLSVETPLPADYEACYLKATAAADYVLFAFAPKLTRFTSQSVVQS